MSKRFTAYILYVGIWLLLQNIVGHIVTDNSFLLLQSGPEYNYTTVGLSILSLRLWSVSLLDSQNMTLRWTE